MENRKKHGIKRANFPLIILMAMERITIKISVSIRYEITLSTENEFTGLMVHDVGLGTLLIIPEKPIQKRISPNHTAHQSSDFTKVVKVDLKEIFITNITMIHQ